MFLYGKKMTELINISSYTIILSLLLFMPFFKKKFLISKKISLDEYDLPTFNILFLINLFLIFSVFNFTITQVTSIFYSIIFIFLIYFLSNFKKLLFPKNIIYFFIFYSIILFILSIDLSKNLFLYWDAQKIWLPKAISFYNDGLIVDLKNTAYSHYSFLGSLLWAFFWKISGSGYEYFGRIFFLAIYLFAILNLLSLISVNKNIKIISFLIFTLITYDYWLFRGTQEILVFSFLLILSKYLFNFFTEDKNVRINLLNIFLCLNLIIWTKNEGIVLSLIILFILIIFSRETLKFKLILTSILFFMILVRFLIFKFNGLDLDLSKDFEFHEMLSIFFNNLTIINLALILKYVIFSLFKFPHIVLSMFFALAIAFDKRLFKKFIFLYVYLFLSIFLIFLIYLSSPHDLDFMVSTGSMRLMLEFSAPNLLFILIFFKDKFKI